MPLATRRCAGLEARFTPESLAFIRGAPVTPKLCTMNERSHVLMCPMRRIQVAFAAPFHWQCGLFDGETELALCQKKDSRSFFFTRLIDKRRFSSLAVSARIHWYVATEAGAASSAFSGLTGPAVTSSHPKKTHQSQADVMGKKKCKQVTHILKHYLPEFTRSNTPLASPAISPGWSQITPTEKQHAAFRAS